MLPETPGWRPTLPGGRGAPQTPADMPTPASVPWQRLVRRLHPTAGPSEGGRLGGGKVGLGQQQQQAERPHARWAAAAAHVAAAQVAAAASLLRTLLGAAARSGSTSGTKEMYHTKYWAVHTCAGSTWGRYMGRWVPAARERMPQNTVRKCRVPRCTLNFLTAGATPTSKSM